MSTPRHDHPFCARIAAGDYAARKGEAVAFPDSYPLTAGHMLVAPIRHEARLLFLSSDETYDLWRLALHVARNLAGDVQDFNIGIKEGPDAGRTLPHVYLHVIPRRAGDVADPRGGVRWMVRERAVYWEE